MLDPFEAITDEQLLTVEELARKCLFEGATLGAVRGYTSDELEAIYHFAHNAYQQHKYEEAVALFLFLVENDHAEHRFWMGLAAAYQMSEQHQRALVAFGMTAFLDATNPWPPIHACECYLAMGDGENARLALDGALGVCEATDDEQCNDGAWARAEKLERRLAQIQAEPTADSPSESPAEKAESSRFDPPPARDGRPPLMGNRRVRRRI